MRKKVKPKDIRESVFGVRWAGCQWVPGGVVPPVVGILEVVLLPTIKQDGRLKTETINQENQQ